MVGVVDGASLLFGLDKLDAGQIVSVHNRPGVTLGFIAEVSERPDGLFRYEVLLDNFTYDSNFPRENLGSPVALRDPVELMRRLTCDMEAFDVFVLISELRRLMRARILQERSRGHE